MVLPDDAALVARCLEGDEDAWSAVVERYADLVHAIGRRCGLGDAECADLVQETFVALVRSLRRLRKRERLVGWIGQTARREAWRIVRRRKQAQRREQAVARDERAGLALPDEALAHLEDVQAVRQAYGAIGERCRRLLDLLFLADGPPPYTEVAERLGLAVGSIGPIRARCLAELEAALRALGFPPP